MALSALGRFDEAFDAVREVRDKDAGFFANFKSPLSADHEDKSLAGDPRRIFCAMQFQRLERCDWTERKVFHETLCELILRPERYSIPLRDRSLPHPALAFPLGARLRQALAHQVAEGVAAEGKPFASGFISRTAPGDKQRLRIGYVSPDFRAHATAHLTRRLYELHDKDRYEVFAYALHPGDGSAIEADIRRGCEHFRRGAHLESGALVGAIRNDEIDILVDLAGYTRHARPELFAARCAPIQVGYLGFPGTLGGNALDYAMVDSIVCPEGCDCFWTESLVRLPGTYAIYDDQTPVAGRSARPDYGLPEQALVLCCFNAAWKINPQVFAIWMRLLARLPQAVLWLWSATPQVRGHLHREAARMEVDARRLLFCGPLEHAAHLARYPLADVFLDTLPCNAHTTAADALWMGVPVVTCVGEEMQGRVAASLLQAAGLSELVAADLADYESLIYRLATEPGILSGLHNKLAERKRVGLLFNTRSKVRDLERAFEMMWQRHCSGLPRTGFNVPSSTSMAESVGRTVRGLKDDLV
jgi:predicted O-linked N-acetylglucosamine transferase (SPINDLY family)